MLPNKKSRFIPVSGWLKLQGKVAKEELKLAQQQLKLAQLYPKDTPTDLPPATMLRLGTLFPTAISLSTARRIDHIRAEPWPINGHNVTKGKHPRSWVDIWVNMPDGTNFIIRSQTNLTVKQARDLYREVTRKVAVFLWENRKVNLQPALAA